VLNVISQNVRYKDERTRLTSPGDHGHRHSTKVLVAAASGLAVSTARRYGRLATGIARPARVQADLHPEEHVSSTQVKLGTRGTAPA
jgi:hypothetical protein